MKDQSHWTPGSFELDLRAKVALKILRDLVISGAEARPPEETIDYVFEIASEFVRQLEARELIRLVSKPGEQYRPWSELDYMTTIESSEK